MEKWLEITISIHLKTARNAKCPIFLGNFTPKTSNYCLKNRVLGFPGGCLVYIFRESWSLQNHIHIPHHQGIPPPRPPDIIQAPEFQLAPKSLLGLEIFLVFFTFRTGKGQGSLNYPFGGNQTMQMYGHFEGFPLNSALFGLVI